MNDETDIFDAMTAKCRAAWADVQDANGWVEEQRGGVDRRTDVTIQNAVVRLRLIEVRIVDNLSMDDAAELTDSINALVAALRQQGAL